MTSTPNPSAIAASNTMLPPEVGGTSTGPLTGVLMPMGAILRLAGGGNFQPQSGGTFQSQAGSPQPRTPARQGSAYANPRANEFGSTVLGQPGQAMGQKTLLGQ